MLGRALKNILLLLLLLLLPSLPIYCSSGHKIKPELLINYNLAVETVLGISSIYVCKCNEVNLLCHCLKMQNSKVDQLDKEQLLSGNSEIIYFNRIFLDFFLSFFHCIIA